ncbi:MAG: site-specific integrase [Rhizobiaceae bacterium]|nr:site-specific integrase [Rhizobiaceae bacterium]MCV0407260.1 site-specific integrase [Rhizobiaceae bacterium]
MLSKAFCYKTCYKVCYKRRVGPAMKYVSFARGRYAVRVTVPPELRAIVGKRELVEPLGADKREAERRAHGVIAGFLATLEDAKERLEASRPTLGSVAKEYFRSELEEDDRGRLELGQETVVGLNRETLAVMATYTRMVASGQMTGQTAEEWLSSFIDFCEKKGVLPDLPKEELLKVLAHVEMDILAAIEARDKGTLTTPEPKSSLLNEPDPEPMAPAHQDRGTGKTLTEIVAAFHRERTAGNRTLAARTMEEHRTAVRMLEEHLGGSVPARSITRKDMLAYKDALLQTPSRYSIRFPGLTLPQAIRANAKRATPYPTLDPATINMKWLSHVRTIFHWAMNNGHVDDNPAAGIRVDEGKGYKEPTRVPFDQDDLAKLFGSGLYLDTPRDQWATEQWALLLALYTGARSSSELARIRLVDIYREQGIDVINLALASKNVRSKRIVPIHQHLIDLGFLDHVERMRKHGKTRLFPDWEPEDKVNRWFLRSYRTKVGVTDKRKVFHSFRHTLKTALARYGVNRDVSDLITGHKDQSVGGIYIGDAAVTMIQAMAEGLNRIDFKLPVVQE